MKFALGFPLLEHPPNPEFLSTEAIATIARAAESAGFSAVYLTEHPIPSDRWLESGGHDALDPFVGLAVAATATSTIALLTNLTPLPFRNPLLLAKSSATLDRLSGGRLILGTGTGYLKSEFFALGVDFDERNDLFDEALAVLRLAWSGESINFEGIHFSVRDSSSLPTPSKREIPVWIGGNSKLSRRRVVEAAQGWMPMPNPRSVAKSRRSAPLETLEDLAEMITGLKEHAARIDRLDPVEVMYMTAQGAAPGLTGWNPDEHLDSVAAHAELGVTWLALSANGQTVAEVLENIEIYGNAVIAQA